jgi:hypothetical protein
MFGTDKTTAATPCNDERIPFILQKSGQDTIVFWRDVRKNIAERFHWLLPSFDIKPKLPHQRVQYRCHKGLQAHRRMDIKVHPDSQKVVEQDGMYPVRCLQREYEDAECMLGETAYLVALAEFPELECKCDDRYYCCAGDSGVNARTFLGCESRGSGRGTEICKQDNCLNHTG